MSEIRPPFVVIKHAPKTQIDGGLDGQPIIGEVRPTEFHILPDGAKGERPSFVMLAETTSGMMMAMQISMSMFRPAYDAMKELYE